MSDVITTQGIKFWRGTPIDLREIVLMVEKLWTYASVFIALIFLPVCFLFNILKTAWIVAMMEVKERTGF